jgi:hypothetical protein
MLRRGAAAWDPSQGIYKVVIPLLALYDKVGRVVIPLVVWLYGHQYN